MLHTVHDILSHNCSCQIQVSTWALHKIKLLTMQLNIVLETQ